MFNDDNGKLSFMRFGAFVALMLGVVLGICGTVGFFFQLKDSVNIIMSSQGMIALVLGAKAWQKSKE